MFAVDASQAGVGEIQTIIKCEGQASNRKCPTRIVEKGPGKCKVYFMPKVPCVHRAFITFGKESLPGSPFLFDIEDATHVTATGHR